MFKFAKRVTSAVVAGAVVLGTLAVYPFGDKAKVNAATLYDSASAINYATILGGAVDYGIVSNVLEQDNHSETTFATNEFIHTSGNNDVDYIDTTALFLVGEKFTSKGTGNDAYIRLGKTTASAVYFEAPSKVFGPGPDGNEFDPSVEAKSDVRNGNFNFEREYGTAPFIQAVNPNANVNVGRLINRLCENGPVEDAELGWAYFLQQRAHNDSYVLNPNGDTCDAPASITFNPGRDKVTIDITDSFYDGKVVYVNITPDMYRCLSNNGHFIIKKNTSSVIVFNIDESVTNNATLTLSKPIVECDGKEYVGTTAQNGDRTNDHYDIMKGVVAADVQNVFNETVIWNVMTKKTVDIDSMGGAMLFPEAAQVNVRYGNSSGWIVAKNRVYMTTEFHFLYGGSSSDGLGQMHFALTKAFTKNYAAHGTVKQDTSVDIPNDSTYTFNFQEFSRPGPFSGEFQSPYMWGVNQDVSVKTDGTVTFPILTFTCLGNNSHYDIPKGQERMFYFRITEKGANTTHPVSAKDIRTVSNSDGYIDIRLKVAVDDTGHFTYFVDYKSVTGDGVVFREYQEDYTDFIKMSGVQFDLGAFYNKVTEQDQVYIDITKTFGGGVTAADLEYLTFNIYEVDNSGASSTSKVVASYQFGRDFEETGTPGVYALKNKFAAETGKTYYVEECNYDLSICKDVVVTYTLPNGKETDATKDGKTSEFTVDSANNANNPYVVSFKNDYTLCSGKIVLTKTIEGPVTDKDLEGLVFEVYKEGSTTPVWTGSLGDTTGSAPKFTVDSKGVYTSEEIGVDVGNYYVVEKLTTDTGVVTVTYKINNKDGNPVVDDVNKEVQTTVFSVGNNETAKLDFKNTYTGGSIQLFKEVEGKVLSGVTEFPVVILGKGDGKYYDAMGTAYDAEKLVMVPTDGSGITITGLPVQEYSISEKEPGSYAALGYKLNINSTQGFDVSVTDANPVVRTLKNIYDEVPIVGSLSITKEQAAGSAAIGANETFEIEVEFDGDITGANGIGTVNYTDRTWVFSLKVGETATLSDIPAGVQFTVKEKVPAGYKDVNEKSGSIPAAGGKVSLTIENYKNAPTTGSLIISKTISDAKLADFERLSFTVVNVDDSTDTIKIPDLTTDNVNAGIWKDEGNGVYTYTVEDLDAGKTYKVTETYDGTEKSTVYELDTSKSNKSGTGKIVAGGEVLVELKDTYTAKTTGSLVIRKTISGAKLNELETISFIVKDESDNTVSVPALTLSNVNAGIWKDEGNGVYTYTITGLEGGKTYTVTEEYNGTEKSTTYTLSASSKTDGSGTIKVGGEVFVELTNNYEKKTTPVTTGSLVISKTISGADLEDFEKLTFTVVNTADSTDTIKIPDLTTDNVKAGIWKDEGNGVYTYTIEGLDADKTYKVTETYDGTGDSSEYELNTSKSKKEGTGKIVAGGEVKVELTDDYSKKSTPVTTGSLVISKTISGADLEDFEKLTFTVVNTADSTDTIKIPDLTTDNVNAGIWKDEGNGVYTYTVEDLDAGKTYKVTETYDGTGDSSEYVLDTSSKTSGTGTVVAGGTVKVEITDNYSGKSIPLPPMPERGSIEITKTISGVDAADLDRSKITFTIEGPAEFNGGNALTVTYEDFVNGRWTLDDVPTGDYTVTETGNGASTVYPLISTTVNGKDAVNDTVTLSKNGTAVFAFINTYDDTVTPYTGTIEITKTLSGAYAADLNVDDMTFTIKGPDSYNGGKIKTISYSDFVDGRWHEDNVPAGEYTVTETGSGATQTMELVLTTVNGENKTSDTKTVSSDGIITFAFFNTYEDTTPVTGSLEIVKVLKGDYPDSAAAKTFKFIVTGPSYPNGTVVTIKGEGSVVLVDLIPGDYTVTEDVDGAAFENYSLKVTGSGAAVTVVAGKTAECEIVNTYTKITPSPTPTAEPTKSPNEDTPTPTPTETPTPTPTIPDSGLKLTFEKKDELGSLIADAVLTLTSLDGFDMSGVTVTQNGKTVSFILSADKMSVSFTTVDTAPSIISGLKAGSYELKETVTPEGYLTADSITFILNDDGSFDEGGGKVTVAGSPVIMVDKADPSYKKDNNDGGDDSGTSIPATGEQMSYYAIAGVMLLGLCAAFISGFAVYQKKKSGI